ncbi:MULTISPECIES: DUF2635 domain-containing protein [Burkholderia]|uniref:DUF2635 domain-containing protein n=1 Tax=Burkholderia TaxID=32008 RepID=UPI000F5E78CA|nr:MULTISPECIES: DUF2635 domain-containing protein [Burkholderia]RQZ74800.1 DUF2635 domain-containing protein [Burkholderia glumae]
MKVIAKAGLRVPVQGKPRKYIAGPDPVEVPETAYYLRRVSDGDLLLQDAEPAATSAPTIDAGDKKTAKGA